MRFIRYMVARVLFLAIAWGGQLSVADEAYDPNCSLLGHEVPRGFEVDLKKAETIFARLTGSGASFCKEASSLASCASFQLYCIRAFLKSELPPMAKSVHQNAHLGASADLLQLERTESLLIRYQQVLNREKEFGFSLAGEDAVFELFKGDSAALQGAYQRRRNLSLASPGAKKIMQQCSGVVMRDQNDVNHRALAENIGAELGVSEIDTTGAFNLESELHRKNLPLKGLVQTAVLADLKRTSQALWAAYLSFFGPLKSDQERVALICAQSNGCKDPLWRRAIEEANDDFKVQRVLSQTATWDQLDLPSEMKRTQEFLNHANHACQVAHDGFVQNRLSFQARMNTMARRNGYSQSQAEGFADQQYRSNLRIQQDAFVTIQDDYQHALKTRLGPLMITDIFRTTVGTLKRDFVYTNCMRGSGILFGEIKLLATKEAARQLYQLDLNELHQLEKNEQRDPREVLLEYLRNNPAVMADILIANPGQKDQRAVCSLIRESNRRDDWSEKKDEVIGGIGLAALGTLWLTGYGAPVAMSVEASAASWGFVLDATVAGSAIYGVNRSWKSLKNSEEDFKQTQQSGATSEFQLEKALGQLQDLQQQQGDQLNQLALQLGALGSGAALLAVSKAVASLPSATVISRFLGVERLETNLPKLKLFTVRKGIEAFQKTAKIFELDRSLYSGLTEAEGVELGALYSRFNSEQALAFTQAIKDANQTEGLQQILRKIAQNPEEVLQPISGTRFGYSFHFKKLMAFFREAQTGRAVEPITSAEEKTVNSALKLIRAAKNSQVKLYQALNKPAEGIRTAAPKLSEWIKKGVDEAKANPWSAVYRDVPLDAHVIPSRINLKNWTFGHIFGSPMEWVTQVGYQLVAKKPMPVQLSTLPSFAVSTYFWVKVWDHWILESSEIEEIRATVEKIDYKPGAEFAKTLLAARLIDGDELASAYGNHRDLIKNWILNPHTPLPRLSEMGRLVHLSSAQLEQLNLAAWNLYQDSHDNYLEVLKQKSPENKTEFWESFEHQLIDQFADARYPDLHRLSAGQMVIARTLLWPIFTLHGVTDIELLHDLYDETHPGSFNNLLEMMGNAETGSKAVISLSDALAGVLDFTLHPEHEMQKAQKAQALVDRHELPNYFALLSDRPDIYRLAYPTVFIPGPLQSPIHLEDELDRWKLFFTHPYFKYVRDQFQIRIRQEGGQRDYESEILKLDYIEAAIVSVNQAMDLIQKLRARGSGGKLTDQESQAVLGPSYFEMGNAAFYDGDDANAHPEDQIRKKLFLMQTECVTEPNALDLKLKTEKFSEIAAKRAQNYANLKDRVLKVWLSYMEKLVSGQIEYSPKVRERYFLIEANQILSATPLLSRK